MAAGATVVPRVSPIGFEVAAGEAVRGAGVVDLGRYRDGSDNGTGVV